MNNTLALFKVSLKTDFMAQFGLKNKKAQTKKSNTVLKTVLFFLFLMLTLGGQFFFVTLQLGTAAVEGGFINEFSNLITLAFLVINLAFAPGFVLTRLFFATDNKLWLPLPLKTTEIFLSRFLVALVSAYLFETLFFLPALIAFNIIIKPAFYIYFFQLILLLVVPLLFASFFFIVFITLERFINIKKHQKLFQVVVLSLMLIVLFVFMFAVSGSDSGMLRGEEELLASLFPQISNMIKPFTFIINGFVIGFSKAGSLGSILYFLLTLVVTALLFFFAYFLAHKRYAHVLFVEGDNKKKKRKDVKQFAYKQKSSFSALINREWKTILRSPAFFFNTLVPPFLILVIAVPSLLPLFLSDSELILGLQQASFLPENGIVIMVVLLVFLFFSSMNMVSSTAFTREGRQAAQLKMYPVATLDIVHAKMFIGYISQVIINLVTLMPFLFIALPPFIFWVIPLLLVFIVPLFTNYLMVLFDLRFPSLNWNTEMAAVKNNKNVLVTMAISFGLVFVVAALLPVVLLIQLSYFWTGFIFIIIFSLLSFLLYNHVKTKDHKLLIHL